MKKRLQALLIHWARILQPLPDPEAKALIDSQSRLLDEAGRREQTWRQQYVERAAELIEARQMTGAGPWLVHESRESLNQSGRFRESSPLLSQGAFGDIELALQNVEWRREVNLSWLEFSRWGIQQIILISRLYFIKNPLIQRGINVAAAYIFGRGVEVSSPDETANEVLKEFFDRNKAVVGQIALTDIERRKYYDGNLFFCFFSDTAATGAVTIRTIDATEIMDIVTSPDDADTPWFYRRVWTERQFDPVNGMVTTVGREAWYPALSYVETVKPPTINGIPVRWDNPILHRKCGSVSKWHFGCPLVYSALDWAKAATKFLEACATVKQSLAQISMTLTTKGGQQALEGMKQQLQTNVGVGTSLWDTNPTAVNASVFGAGPGTTLAAFQTRGAGGDPEEVRRYVLMVATVFGIPETFFADVKTGNLATAQSLDRPTELNFLEKQEAWREDLLTIAKYVLSVSRGASAGRIREAHTGDVLIMEAHRERSADGRRWVETWKHVKGADGKLELWEAGQPVPPNKIIVSVNFPAIREGDLQQEVAAVVEAMTLGNRAGQIVGIDEKLGVRTLYDRLGIEGGDEITEEQYPEATYDPDREQEILPDPIGRTTPGGGVIAQGAHDPPPGTVKQAEALSRRLARRLIEAVEAERNGADHHHTRT